MAAGHCFEHTKSLLKVYLQIIKTIVNMYELFTFAYSLFGRHVYFEFSLNPGAGAATDDVADSIGHVSMFILCRLCECSMRWHYEP